MLLLLLLLLLQRGGGGCGWLCLVFIEQTCTCALDRLPWNRGELGGVGMSWNWEGHSALIIPSAASSPLLRPYNSYNQHNTTHHLSCFQQLFGLRSSFLCILCAEKHVHNLRQKSLARFLHACLPACNHFALMPVTLCKEGASEQAGGEGREERGGGASSMHVFLLPSLMAVRPAGRLAATLQLLAFLQESE